MKFISAVKPSNSHTCKDSHSKTIGVQLKREEWRNKGEAECDRVSEERPEHWLSFSMAAGLEACWLRMARLAKECLLWVLRAMMHFNLNIRKHVLLFALIAQFGSAPFSNMFLSKSGRSLKWVGFWLSVDALIEVKVSAYHYKSYDSKWWFAIKHGGHITHLYQQLQTLLLCPLNHTIFIRMHSSIIEQHLFEQTCLFSDRIYYLNLWKMFTYSYISARSLLKRWYTWKKPQGHSFIQQNIKL